ncbi:hypothetical protein Tco_0048099 [Tanacetum coccineum]
MHVAHLSPHVSNHSESLYHLVLTPTCSAAVAVFGVPEYGSRVHTHDHDGSEAPDESPDQESHPIPHKQIDPLRVHIDSL